MKPSQLEEAARSAELAADAARREILPRFRSVAVEHKADGSPVTEADRSAERVVREILTERHPDFGVLGEEYGSEGGDDAPRWIVDPIDGTVAFSRGIPLFSTLIALVEDGIPVVGLIDLPALGERYVGYAGGGCHRNGQRVHVSDQKDLSHSMIAHGDVFCFRQCGEEAVFTRMSEEVPMLRGYTDAFGHAQVLGGGVDAMVDLQLKTWDAAATLALVPEAGGLCVTFAYPDDKLGLVFGSPSLVETLASWLTLGKPITSLP